MNEREALIKAAWLTWRNYPPAKDWGRDLLKRWLAWHMGEGFLIFVMDEETVAGMVICRPLMEPEDCYSHYKFDQEGTILFIDLMISKHPDAIVAAGFAVLGRFGMRQTIAWEYKGELYTYPAAKFRRNLLRTKNVIYHGE